MSNNNLNTVTVDKLPMMAFRAMAAKRPLAVWGPPGVGKSEGLKSCAAQHVEDGGTLVELGDPCGSPRCDYGYFDFRLTSTDAAELGGLLDLDRERGVAKRLVPDWWPGRERTDIPERGMLVLEEAPNATPLVQVAAYQMVQDRRLGPSRLKEGWQIVLTGNRISDGAGVGRVPEPLKNRMIHVGIRSDANVWTAWALRSKKIHPSIVTFIKQNPQYLNEFDKHMSDDRDGMAYATERSWHILSDQMFADDELGHDREALLIMADGTVGAPSILFAEFVTLWTTVGDVQEMIEDPMDAVVHDSVATNMMVATAMLYQLTRDNADNISKYVARLSPEIGAFAYSDALQNGKEYILNTPAFVSWSAEHGALLAGL